MRDIDILKDTLKKIKCNFTSEKTLIGEIVSVYSIDNKLTYEFNQNGEFERVY